MKEDDANLTKIEAVLYGGRGDDGFIGLTRAELKELSATIKELDGRVSGVSQIFTREFSEIVGKIDRETAKISADIVGISGRISSIEKCANSISDRLDAQEKASKDNDVATKTSREATKRVLIASIISSTTAIITGFWMFIKP